MKRGTVDLVALGVFVFLTVVIPATVKLISTQSLEIRSKADACYDQCIASGNTPSECNAACPQNPGGCYYNKCQGSSCAPGNWSQPCKADECDTNDPKACRPSQICSPGQTQCAGDRVGTCNGSGTGWTYSQCPNGCQLVNNVAQCKPQLPECPHNDGSRCSNPGVCNYTCNLCPNGETNGVCNQPSQICSPNRTTCTAGISKTCNSTGTDYAARADCAYGCNSTGTGCNSNPLVPTCPVSCSNRCDNPPVCNPYCSSEKKDYCTGLGQDCKEDPNGGACVQKASVCTNGQKQCAGTASQVCVNGQMETIEECGGKQCVNGFGCLPDNWQNWRCDGPNCDKCCNGGWWQEGCRKYGFPNGCDPLKPAPLAPCGGTQNVCQPGQTKQFGCDGTTKITYSCPAGIVSCWQETRAENSPDCGVKPPTTTPTTPTTSQPQVGSNLQTLAEAGCGLLYENKPNLVAACAKNFINSRQEELQKALVFCGPRTGCRDSVTDKILNGGYNFDSVTEKFYLSPIMVKPYCPDSQSVITSNNDYYNCETGNRVRISSAQKAACTGPDGNLLNYHDCQVKLQALLSPVTPPAAPKPVCPTGVTGEMFINGSYVSCPTGEVNKGLELKTVGLCADYVSGPATYDTCLALQRRIDNRCADNGVCINALLNEAKDRVIASRDLASKFCSREVTSTGQENCYQKYSQGYYFDDNYKKFIYVPEIIKGKCSPGADTFVDTNPSGESITYDCSTGGVKIQTSVLDGDRKKAACGDCERFGLTCGFGNLCVEVDKNVQGCVYDSRRCSNGMYQSCWNGNTYNVIADCTFRGLDCDPGKGCVEKKSQAATPPETFSGTLTPYAVILAGAKSECESKKGVWDGENYKCSNIPPPQGWGDYPVVGRMLWVGLNRGSSEKQLSIVNGCTPITDTIDATRFSEVYYNPQTQKWCDKPQPKVVTPAVPVTSVPTQTQTFVQTVTWIPTWVPTPIATLLAAATNTNTSTPTTQTPTQTPTQPPTPTAIQTIVAAITAFFTPTPTSTTLPTQTPGETRTPTVAQNPSATAVIKVYDGWQQIPLAIPAGQIKSDPLKDYDLNIENRHPTVKTGLPNELGLKGNINITAGEKGGPQPQLTCLMMDSQGQCITDPAIVNVYHVGKAPWDKDEGYDISMVGLDTNGATSVVVPPVKDGSDTPVAVLFAKDGSITLKYYYGNEPKNASIVNNYALHITGINIDPAILAQYNALQKLNTTADGLFVLLKPGMKIGTPQKELQVVVQAFGQYVDTRSTNDWWNPLPTGYTPRATRTPSALTTPKPATTPLATAKQDSYVVGVPLTKGSNPQTNNKINADLLTPEVINTIIPSATEKNDPMHPDLSTSFGMIKPTSVVAYKACSACGNGPTMIGMQVPDGTPVTAPTGANSKNYDIGGGFGTMVAYIGCNNTCIALNYAPDALKDSAYTVVYSNIQIDQNLIDAYNRGIKSGNFPTLTPGQAVGVSRGEVRTYVVNDGKIANPYSYFPNGQVPTSSYTIRGGKPVPAPIEPLVGTADVAASPSLDNGACDWFGGLFVNLGWFGCAKAEVGQPQTQVDCASAGLGAIAQEECRNKAAWRGAYNACNAITNISIRVGRFPDMDCNHLSAPTVQLDPKDFTNAQNIPAEQWNSFRQRVQSRIETVYYNCLGSLSGTQTYSVCLQLVEEQKWGIVNLLAPTGIKPITMPTK